MAPPAGWWRRLGRLGAGGAGLAVPGRARPDAGAGTASPSRRERRLPVRPAVARADPARQTRFRGLAPGVASLGLNEGLERAVPVGARGDRSGDARRSNRYPERGSADARRGARRAARRRRRRRSSVAAGADALIGYVCQADARPGRRGDRAVAVVPELRPRPAEARCRAGARSARRDGRIDLDAVRAAVTPRTRLALPRDPEQPDRADGARATELIALVRDLPEHVLPVIDEAYFDYLDPADRFDAIEDLVRAGDDVLALRTFSKLYGLAGLRVGYGVGPAAVVAAIRKVQRGYDVGDARRRWPRSRASTDAAEVERRRAANRAAIAALDRRCCARTASSRVPAARRTSSSSTSEPTRTRSTARCSPRASACSPGAPFGAPDVAADRRRLARGSRAPRRRARRGRVQQRVNHE